jgi:hypothetical protein
VSSRAINAPVILRADGSTSRLQPVELHADAEGRITEERLQQAIHRDASCIPFDEIEPGITGFVPICREMPTPRGPIDNLLMTPAGHIALVETKLFRNPQARREVLGQALDYAVSLFGMGYEAFETAVLGGQFAPRPKPSKLHDFFKDCPDEVPEERFIDAVSGRLKRGEIIIVVAGDGIRSETESLLDGINPFAQFHFTLALAEISLFTIPGTGDLLVRPRTLAKTQLLPRPVFVVQAVASENDIPAAAAMPARVTDQSEQEYWRQLEKAVPGARVALAPVISSLEALGGYAEFLASLNFKWDPPNAAKSMNLGYIMKTGAMWFDAPSWSAPRHLADAYVDDAARLFGGQAFSPFKSGVRTVYRDGKPLRLSDAVLNLAGWPDLMGRVIESLDAVAYTSPQTLSTVTTVPVA